MKQVNPHIGSATTTLTDRLAALAPRRDDLVDACCLSLLTMIGVLGFATTFDSSWYLLVGFIGTALGLLIAHLANVLRWHWLIVGLLVVFTFFILGGTVALRADLIAGFLPSLTTLSDLAFFAVTGWKDLLTTVPPVDGLGPYLVLPYLFGLAIAAAGMAVARRVRGLLAPLILPTAGLALSLAMGTYEPAAPLIQGLGFAFMVIIWLSLRFARFGVIGRVSSGSAPWLRIVVGAAVLGLALGGGALLGGSTVANNHRFVLRTIVQPPLDLSEYPSPLVGFRKYSSATKKMLFDQPLLKVSVTGTPETKTPTTSATPVAPKPNSSATLLRITTLDTYTGTSWSAARDLNHADNGFRRVGTKVPNPPKGSPETIEITVRPAYASNQDLNIWVPALGPVTQISFSPNTAKAHTAALRQNLDSGQTLVSDRLKIDETVRVTSIAVPLTTDKQEYTPSGSPTVTDFDTEVVAQTLERIAPKEATAWKRLSAAAAALKTGAWSDGTRAGEGKYLPGHSTARLTRFLREQPFIGSDEQYAAAFGLMANRIGFPARVIFGASIPTSGEVKGKDITAWVEIFTTEAGWVALAPAQFIPDRDKHPDQQPQVQKDPESSVVVPPPNPQRPPGSFDSVFGSDLSADQLPSDSWAKFWRVFWAVFRISGPPILLVSLVVSGLLGAKAWRRSRRRKRGSPAEKVMAGWAEVTDRTRDLGFVVPRSWTRVEQASLVGGCDVLRLAAAADAAVFSATRVDDSGAAAYWKTVLATRKELVADLPWWRRWWTALNPKSLLPSR